MHIIQILLPLYDNRGKVLPKSLFREVKTQLTKRFHGLTAYNRAPAEGLWETSNHTKQDQIIIYEVIARALERKWWSGYRLRLEKKFKQQKIVIRSYEIELL